MAIYRRGKSWVADYWIGGREGRRVRRTAETKKEAEAIERDAKAKEYRGEAPTELKPTTLSGLIELYRALREAGNAPTTRECDNLVFKHMLAYYGDRPVQSITCADIEGYKAARLKKVKAVTVNLELRVSRSLFNRAVDWGYLRQSPCKGMKMLRTEDVPRRFLSPEEGHRLIEACSGQLRTFMALALHTGLRKSELFRLRWEDVNVEKDELTVRTGRTRRTTARGQDAPESRKVPRSRGGHAKRVEDGAGPGQMNDSETPT